MGSISEQLANIWPYLAIIGGITVIGIIVTIIMSKNQKKKAAAFVEQHPEAVKVYLTNKAFITQEAVMVHLVNKEHPIKFSEKGKTGFYLLPGTSEVQISYTYTRPGVMYRNVTQSTGAVDKELEVEANKSYMLSFDRKAEEFTFEEI